VEPDIFDDVRPRHLLAKRSFIHLKGGVMAPILNTPLRPDE
jgi:hypothetical protein